MQDINTQKVLEQHSKDKREADNPLEYVSTTQLKAELRRRKKERRK